MWMRRTITRGVEQTSESVQGFSLIELLVVVAIILIIAAIAVPNLLRSKIAANEAAAAENLRAVSTAVTAYNSTWGNGYPPSLASLGGTSLAATCDQAQLLGPLITTPPYQQSGYIYGYTGASGTVNPVTGCSAPGFNAYLATATPTTQGITGVRSFCSDLPGVIHYDLTGTTAASVASCEALPVL